MKGIKTVNIKINDDWKLKTLELNVVLCQRVKQKDGEAGWRNVGYYQKIEQALDRLFDEGLYSSGAESWEELKLDLAKLRDETIRACKNK